MARSSTTSDVFNAIAEAHRREVLDALAAGEKAVGAIVEHLSMSQPQVSNTYGYSKRWGSSSAGRRAVGVCTTWNLPAFGRCRSGWPSTNGRGTTASTGWTTTSRSYNDKETSSDN